MRTCIVGLARSFLFSGRVLFCSLFFRPEVPAFFGPCSHLPRPSPRWPRLFRPLTLFQRALSPAVLPTCFRVVFLTPRFILFLSQFRPSCTFLPLRPFSWPSPLSGLIGVSVLTLFPFISLDGLKLDVGYRVLGFSSSTPYWVDLVFPFFAYLRKVAKKAVGSAFIV